MTVLHALSGLLSCGTASFENGEAMNEVTLCGMPVRVDEDGLICLTDMWKASGGDNKNRVKYFLDNDQTLAFMRVVEKGGNPPFKKTVGRNGGTWAHKLVAYKYAAWINPEFEYGVYTVLDRFFTGQLVLPQQELHEHVIKVKLSEECGSFHGKGLNKRRWEKKDLEQEGLTLLRKYQHQFNFTPLSLLK